MTTTFTVDPEAVAKLAADKLADEVADEHDIYESASKTIQSRIDKLFAEKIDSLIENALSSKLEEVMNQAIQPVDIFGDKVGEPTTIRDTLNERAKEFWNTPVDSTGKPADRSRYNWQEKSKTRAEWMLGKVVSEKFSEEVKQNAVNILAVFKEKIRADGHAALDKHIDELVRIKSR